MLTTVQELHTRAALPACFRVAGVELLPLRVGHVRILTALGLFDAVSPADLICAAAVCSRPPGDFVPRGLNSRTFRFRLWWHRRRLGADWDWTKTRECWRAYLDFYADKPSTVPTENVETRRSETPLTAAMRVRLCGKMGYSPEAFDDVLYLQAMIDYCVLQESEGLVTMLNLTSGAIARWKQGMKEAA